LRHISVDIPDQKVQLRYNDLQIIVFHEYWIPLTAPQPAPRKTGILWGKLPTVAKPATAGTPHADPCHYLHRPGGTLYFAVSQVASRERPQTR
ncbi:hypothetical protein RZS08_04470, partial [Arthrospira platensis SPKY1]|nr:hypothetical protein [Arthrospira platensis SPKY1]